MRIHKEGYGIIRNTFLIVAAIVLCIFLFFGWGLTTQISIVAGVIFFFFIVRFFRVPKRVSVVDKDLVVAAADGKIVIVQEVEENEFLKCKCMQVSIFMSVFNVHVNYYPVGGKVLYSKHHHGKYLVAFHQNHPKRMSVQALLLKLQVAKRYCSVKLQATLPEELYAMQRPDIRQSSATKLDSSSLVQE